MTMHPQRSLLSLVGRPLLGAGALSLVLLLAACGGSGGGSSDAAAGFPAITCGRSDMHCAPKP